MSTLLASLQRMANSANVRRLPFRAGQVVSFRFPGRWMSDSELDRLRLDLEDIARARLGALPPYGVFAGGRAPFENRIVNLVYRRGEPWPVAFSAMVHCPLVIEGEHLDVVNLGLTIARANGPERTSLARLYFTPLLRHYANRGFRPFWIATFTQKPRTVGTITDAFTDVYPDYRGRTRPSRLHRMIADAVFASCLHDSGVGADAIWDPERFVVRASCTGPSALLRQDFAGVPKYAIPAANDFCREELDYAAGDDFLLVGRVDAASAWRGLCRRLANV